MLRDFVALADDEYCLWGVEGQGTKRFRTPRTHQLLHAVHTLASAQHAHAMLRQTLTEDDRAALRTLAAREAELGAAARAANAALAADDYDEAV